jgi:hypothetical protein
MKEFLLRFLSRGDKPSEEALPAELSLEEQVGSHIIQMLAKGPDADKVERAIKLAQTYGETEMRDTYVAIIAAGLSGLPLDRYVDSVISMFETVASKGSYTTPEQVRLKLHKDQLCLHQEVYATPMLEDEDERTG